MSRTCGGFCGAWGSDWHGGAAAGMRGPLPFRSPPFFPPGPMLRRPPVSFAAFLLGCLIPLAGGCGSGGDGYLPATGGDEGGSESAGEGAADGAPAEVQRTEATDEV